MKYYYYLLKTSYVICVNKLYCPYTIVTMKKELVDTKGVVKIRKSKKDRQHNVQSKKDILKSIKIKILRTIMLDFTESLY